MSINENKKNKSAQDFFKKQWETDCLKMIKGIYKIHGAKGKKSKKGKKMQNKKEDIL